MKNFSGGKELMLTDCSCVSQTHFINLIIIIDACRRIFQDFSYECITKIYFSYFSTKTYVVGTQKNRLNETVLESIQNIC